ncbi:MAG: hypothetical protein LBS16_01970 [Prevotellaceae bacterium]|nr:hypothetical protein [Prevotellaceae bacterium]
MKIGEAKGRYFHNRRSATCGTSTTHQPLPDKAGLFITCRTFQVQVREATFSANCAIACMRL